MGVENENSNDIQIDNVVSDVENVNSNDIQIDNLVSDVENENPNDIQILEEMNIENINGVEKSNPKKNRKDNGNYDIETKNLVENEEEFLATRVFPHTYENGEVIEDCDNGVFYFTVVVNPSPPQIMDIQSYCDAQGGPSAVLVSTSRTGPNNYKYEFKYESPNV